MNLEQELENLIEKRANKKAAELTGNAKEYKEWIESLDEDISILVNEVKDLIEDCKENGLTLNSIEAEGFLRGILHVEAIIKSNKKWLN